MSKTSSSSSSLLPELICFVHKALWFNKNQKHLLLLEFSKPHNSLFRTSKQIYKSYEWFQWQKPASTSKCRSSAITVESHKQRFCLTEIKSLKMSTKMDGRTNLFWIVFFSPPTPASSFPSFLIAPPLSSLSLSLSLFLSLSQLTYLFLILLLFIVYLHTCFNLSLFLLLLLNLLPLFSLSLSLSLSHFLFSLLPSLHSVSMNISLCFHHNSPHLFLVITFSIKTLLQIYCGS